MNALCSFEIWGTTQQMTAVLHPKKPWIINQTFARN